MDFEGTYYNPDENYKKLVRYTVPKLYDVFYLKKFYGIIEPTILSRDYFVKIKFGDVYIMSSPEE